MNKPYSESCDQNRDAILSVIQPLFEHSENVLEIGSGTGQHAVYFAQKMPYLNWHTSDCKEYMEGIKCWLDDAKLSNAKHPIELNVTVSRWPTLPVDTVFTANTAHIMHNNDVQNLIAGVGELLPTGGNFIIYGPFNYKGQYTSDSNKNFDVWLKDRDASSGIKDFETINGLAQQSGLTLTSDYTMPANNRILHFTKIE